MSVTSTCLTLILDSNSGVINLNYPIDSEALLTLTNVLLSFDSAGESLTAGNIIYADLGQLTSHTKLTGNLNDNQVLVLTNNDLLQTSRYSPQIPVGVDSVIPSRISYRISKRDGSLVLGIKNIILQFGIVYKDRTK